MKSQTIRALLHKVAQLVFQFNVDYIYFVFLFVDRKLEIGSVRDEKHVSLEFYRKSSLTFNTNQRHCGWQSKDITNKDIVGKEYEETRKFKFSYFI